MWWCCKHSEVGVAILRFLTKARARKVFVIPTAFCFSLGSSTNTWTKARWRGWFLLSTGSTLWIGGRSMIACMFLHVLARHGWSRFRWFLGSYMLVLSLGWTVNANRLMCMMVEVFDYCECCRKILAALVGWVGFCSGFWLGKLMACRTAENFSA